jgi:hypothetical protein
MIPIAIVLTASAVATLLLAGYLQGVRRGRAARAALEEDRDRSERRAVELEARLLATPAQRPDQVKVELEGMLAPLLADSRKDAGVAELRRDIETLFDAVRSRERNNDAFRDEVRGLLTAVVQKAQSPEQMQRDLKKMMAPLFTDRSDGTVEMRKMMSEVLGPMLDRERIGRELSSIHVGGGGLGELPKLLDAICEKASFSVVVLSDDAGLPLAASSGADDVEMLAGTAAFFLTMSERAERANLPRPLSCVVLDENNRLTVHRMFMVGASRFTLSAVSRGMNVAPGALDPALSPLERVLSPKTLS